MKKIESPVGGSGIMIDESLRCVKILEIRRKIQTARMNYDSNPVFYGRQIQKLKSAIERYKTKEN